MKNLKKEQDGAIITSAEPEAQKEKGIVVSIPLVWFIVLEVVIVALSVGITIIVINYLKQKQQKNKK